MAQVRNTYSNTGLNALRGIGITGIVLYHLFPSVFCGGFLGVPLFFVLSGYLMYTTSEKRSKKGTFHAFDYYKRRIHKILPPLFSMVMCVCCYLTITHSRLLFGMKYEVLNIFLGCDNWWQIKQNASYFSRIANTSPFTHLWFLAVEIQFYALWPVLFSLYKKCCKIIDERKMCFIFLLFAILSAAKMFLLYQPDCDPSRVYYGTDTMAFSLFIGMFLGAAREHFNILCFSVKRNTFFIFGSFMLIICILYVTVDGQLNFLYQGGMFAISIMFAVMINIIENQSAELKNMHTASALSFLGCKSYGIYLWHYPIIILSHI